MSLLPLLKEKWEKKMSLGNKKPHCIRRHYTFEEESFDHFGGFKYRVGERDARLDEAEKCTIPLYMDPKFYGSDHLNRFLGAAIIEEWTDI
jgi:hypothetical protein